MQTKTTCFGYLIVTMMFVFLIGCGGGGGGGVDHPPTVAVSGTVTFQGKPLEGATVYFVSEKFSGSGKTNAEGRYELVQGAVPGKNKVSISKIDGGENVNNDPASGLDLEQARAASAAAEASDGQVKTKIVKDLIPKEYSDPNQSQLTVDVPAGGTTSADFRLN